MASNRSGAAARMLAGKRGGGLRLDRLAGLVRVDHHVLGGVVLHHASHVGNEAEPQQVEHKHKDAHAAFDQPKRRSGLQVEYLAGHDQGDYEEQRDGCGKRDDDGDTHACAGDRSACGCLVFTRDDLRRFGQGAHAKAQSFPRDDDAAKDRDAGKATS